MLLKGEIEKKIDLTKWSKKISKILQKVQEQKLKKKQGSNLKSQ